MRALAALLILTLTATGCSRRERGNPFDPGNPATGGRPAGFVALAGNSNIVLRWQRLQGDLVGYRLARRVEGDSIFRVLVELVPPTTTSYADFGLQNGKRHTYRLSFVFDAGPASDAAEDFGIPGPLRPWVTAFGSGELLRLTADGRRVLSSDPFYVNPTAVAVDPTQGLVWVSDPYSGVVVRINPGNGERLIVNDPGLPGAIAIDPVRHTAWVCDERQGEVAQFRSDGEPGVPPAIGPIQLALAVAVDPLDQSVWVCDNGARAVRQFTTTGLARWARSLPRPSRIAIDSLTRIGWVTSFESSVVMRVASNGAVLDTLHGFLGPIGVAVDARRGRVWIADAVAGTIVALHRDGTVERRTPGFSEVRELAVDLATGNVWATVPGDGRVVVLSPAGAIVTQIAGLSLPHAIALDPGTALSAGLASRVSRRNSRE